ncbi:hypothetical protein E6Q11_05775 [Candidatus Dojkabacteria bacterium]|uniref:Uncharacterized protein n=1 Tax=Candidatus Dojkabacteria bacterium TaxID=2099670 RepID=A0A5C7J3X2_9BACT|nr:MAG: hypothetical protein E6Q11_05775 [Candidatus Dojkabacteria bacterium]
MIVVRRSIVSDMVHEMDLPITQEQIAAWEAGTLVQYAFPHLTASQREFIMTGITEQEWNDMFIDDEPESSVEDGYEHEDDGQPSEMQEWHDFDPDC